MTLTEYARALEEHLIIRFPTTDGRWYASFEHAEVLLDGFLSGTTGYGSTPDLALKDYTKNIVGCTLAFDAFGKRRREYNVPKDLVY